MLPWTFLVNQGFYIPKCSLACVGFKNVSCHFFLLTFKVKVKGQRSRLRLDCVTYNINNYDQDNVFEKYKTSVIDSKHISTIFDVTFK